MPTEPGSFTLDVLIDLGDLWTRAKQSVPDTQRAWVDLTEPVALTDDALVVVTGNDFTKDMLETKLRPHVQQALADQLGYSVTIEVLVDHARAPKIPEELTDDLADATLAEPVEPIRVTADQNETPLNPRYTFDSFVYGPSNRFAHAAALAVAAKPGATLNQQKVLAQQYFDANYQLNPSFGAPMPVWWTERRYEWPGLTWHLDLLFSPSQWFEGAGLIEPVMRLNLPGALVAICVLPLLVLIVTEYRQRGPRPAHVSAFTAIRSFESIVLLAGGRNKGLDLSALHDGVEHVRAVVGIGESGAEVLAAFPDRPGVLTQSMSEAVLAAADLAGQRRDRLRRVVGQPQHARVPVDLVEKPARVIGIWLDDHTIEAEGVATL